MKITIELSQQAVEWLFWRVLELGPKASIETIAANLVEQAAQQAAQQQLEQNEQSE